MNRKFVVSILALILALVMVLSLVVSVLPLAAGTLACAHETHELPTHNTHVCSVSEYAG
ncbi:unknown [Firmicutes bacterium CAG:555]|nr:unknown [Firmicutes bacterium CAG:555]